ncbi:MAG: carbohydrate kinase family protein [Microbacteriaceae bacterium]|nr:MAG: carbohydrate kinase family protein [Microbacteriaceae bacterium]
MTATGPLPSVASVLDAIAASRVLVTMWRPVVDIQLHVAAIPSLGEKVLSQSVQITPGGVDGNYAASMGSIGANVTVVGSDSNDGIGKADPENLREHGVTVRLDTASAGPATVCYVLIDRNGERSVIVAYPKDGSRVAEGVARGVRQVAADAWDLCYLGVLRAAHQEVISLLPPAAIVVATVEVSDWQGSWLEQSAHALNIVFCAEETFAAHAATLQGLQKRHRWTLVVTSGAKGSRIIDEDGVITDVAASHLDGPVVDTTGAGDAFASAFSAAYLLGLRGGGLLRVANWYAAKKIQVLGPRNFPLAIKFAQVIVEETQSKVRKP